MRVLCVGRHTYLSEHLCRYFRDLGAECRPVIGTAAVPSAATEFEPHIVVSDSDLLSPAQMDIWSNDSVLADVPVIAVSLTHRPEEACATAVSGLAGVFYLPALDRDQALALLAGAYRPRGVQSPAAWPVIPPAHSPTLR